ncbi:GDSL esterase/lipase-like protein [Tanacetum coccineum]
MPISNTIVTATVVILLLITLTTAATPASFKKIYAFGDSYTDTGNKHWRQEQALTPHNTSQTSHDGRHSFHHPTIVTLMAARATAIRHCSFVLRIILRLDITPQSVLQHSFIGLLAQWHVLLNKGAKYMVVQGLPATGCLTLAMYLSPENDRDDMGCVASVNNQSYIHNNILQTNIQNLRRKYPKAIIVYADYWKAYNYIIKNAPKLGFHELYKVCCGSSGGPYNFDLFTTCGSQNSSSCQDPSQYINWDGVHLTRARL